MNTSTATADSLREQPAPKHRPVSPTRPGAAVHPWPRGRARTSLGSAERGSEVL